MKVLLTGADGQVGRALAATCPGEVELCTATHTYLDITDPALVSAVVTSVAPSVIINAAAYTAVDRAEDEPAQAEAVNALGPAHLAEAARALPGCRLVQLSTDYVFDGRSGKPYQPSDPPHPLSIYGLTKLKGEGAVMRILDNRALIVRTAWVYAPQGRNFLRTMLRLMRERDEVRVVADQHGSPTAASSVARAIWSALARPQLCGILHWTDAGIASWYEFACAIAREAVAAGLLAKRPQVRPISTADYPAAAVRPARSVLDLSSSAAALELTPLPWAENVRVALHSLLEGDPG